MVDGIGEHTGDGSVEISKIFVSQDDFFDGASNSLGIVCLSYRPDSLIQDKGMKCEYWDRHGK